MGDAQLKDATQQQWQVEESHQVLAGHHSATLGKSSFEDISEQLSQTTRTLCRHLKRNEKACSVLKNRTSTTRSPHLVNCQQFTGLFILGLKAFSFFFKTYLSLSFI